MNPTKQHDIKDCSTCEHLMLVGAFHRPECSEQDYLPELVQENGVYKPIARGCKFYKPFKEEQNHD